MHTNDRRFVAAAQRTSCTEQATVLSMRETARILTMLAIALVAAAAGAARIGRVDFYDRADNLLLFTVLDYDSAEANTGRTVYAADSTFLRWTEVQREAGTQRVVREISYNHAQDTFSTTTAGTVGALPSITVRDQFGLDLLGLPATFEQVSAGVYRVAQRGVHAYTISYQYSGEDLRRIEVTDPSGALVCYAIPLAPAGVLPGAMRALAGPPKVTAPGMGRFAVEVGLRRFARVRVTLYGLDGRQRARLLDRGVAPGASRFVLKPDHAAAGACVLAVEVDGDRAQTAHVPVIVTR